MSLSVIKQLDPIGRAVEEMSLSDYALLIIQLNRKNHAQENLRSENQGQNQNHGSNHQGREGKWGCTIRATPAQMFNLVEQAWNMRECVRLLSNGNSARQFTVVDEQWIMEANEYLDSMFSSVGLASKRALEIFSPDNCSDLIVPHVVFETASANPDLRELKGLVDRMIETTKGADDSGRE